MAKDSSGRAGPRPGGRSARVQAAVHQAVRALQAEGDEADLTVPAVAARAGVTPSTIYRRWGSLAQLLSDVAVENLRPETDPDDTGSLAGDLRQWLEQYIEEICSEPGQAMLRDVLAAGATGNAPQCRAFTAQQLEAIGARARARGEAPPPVDLVLDRVIAPLVYRLLFSSASPTIEDCHRLLDGLLQDGAA
jgi:AcrR family transcriptional regulator